MAGLLWLSCRSFSHAPPNGALIFVFCPVIFSEIKQLGAYGGCVYALRMYLAVWRFIAYSKGVRLFLVPG